MALTFAALWATALWGQSKFTGHDWVRLDTAFEVKLIRAVIEEAKRDNVIIRLSPEYYTKELDFTVENGIRNHDDEVMSSSVGIMLHTIAAMEGDWDNGENKLEHAKKWLGPEIFESFRKTYPQKYARLLRDRETGSRWKSLGFTQNERLYYDSASINYLAGIIKTPEKTVYALEPSLSCVTLPNGGRTNATGFPCSYTIYSLDVFRSGVAINGSVRLTDPPYRGIRSDCFILFFETKPPLLVRQL